MENRKGNGIFLGIVSIATLIVAIIGATFAYFSASTESEEGAVGATAYEYSLSLTVTPIYPTGAAAIIPMQADGAVLQDTDKDGTLEEGEVYTDSEGNTVTNLLYALNEAAKECVDDHGLQVCALYQVSITNNAVNEIRLSGTLVTNTNKAAEGKEAEGRTPFKHLTYQAIKHEGEFDKDADTHNFKLLENHGPVTLAETEGESVDIADIVVPGAIEGDDGELIPQTGTSFVLIYLAEASEDDNNGDQSSEMGATFTGQLKYTSGAGTTLTGSFTVSAPADEEATS